MATVTVLVIEQEFASVMVHVNVPAARPVAVEAVPPLGAQLYVYPPAPPETPETVAVPVFAVHDVGVEEILAVIAVGCVKVNVRVV